MKYSYEINPRPAELGGGWQLRLIEDDEEVGGGVFPVAIGDAHAGMVWWNECTEQERAHWLTIAASTVTGNAANAYHAYMLSEAHADAETTAYDWLDSRPQ